MGAKKGLLSFEMKVAKCDVLKDVTHDQLGNEKITLRVRVSSKDHWEYAYSLTNGLTLLNPRIPIDTSKRDIISELLSINLSYLDSVGSQKGGKVKSVDSLIRFIETYGFFFELPQKDIYYEVSCVALMRLVLRFQRVILLLQEYSLMNTDYIERKEKVYQDKEKLKKLAETRRKTIKWKFDVVYTLLLSDDSLMISDGKKSWCCFSHGQEFTSLWYKTQNENTSEYLRQEILLYDPETDEMVETYKVDDTFDTCNYIHPSELVCHCSDDIEGKMRAHIKEMYVWNDEKVSICTRYTADLMYHFACDSALTAEKSGNNVKPKLEISKILVSEKGDLYGRQIDRIVPCFLENELSHATSNVDICFDSTRCKPIFNIPDLWTALYASLMDFQERGRVYQRCQNPTCNNYFFRSVGKIQPVNCSDRCRKAKANQSAKKKQCLR